MKRSKVEVRCNDDAFELVLRSDDKDLEARIRHGLADAGLVLDGWSVPVEQRVEGSRLVDCVDRVQLCVRVVKALVAGEL